MTTPTRSARSAAALAGALHGEAGIPARWLAPLELREPLRAVADRLADRAGV